MNAVRRRFLVAFPIFLALVIFLGSGNPAGAVDTYWLHDSATPGLWTDPMNWDNGVPVAGDKAYLDNGGTAVISADYAAAEIYAGETSGNAGHIEQNGGSGTLSSNLYLGHAGNSTGTYVLSDGALSAHAERVGWFGEGRFTQSGGINTPEHLDLGVNSATATGRYDLEDGYLSVTNGLLIGYIGTGSFVQSGGVSEMGFIDTWNGSSCTLDDGQLSANNEYINESCTFAQNGGIHTVTSNLYVGYNDGTGQYMLNGGQLSATDEYIGLHTLDSPFSGFAYGVFTQEDGSNNCDSFEVRNGSHYILHAGELNAGTIRVWAEGYFANSGGAGSREITVTGSFLNESTMYEEFCLLNTGLTLQGGEAGSPVTLGMNSCDKGAGWDGYTNNFALGSLTFKGSEQTNYYKLLSDVYTFGLVIEDGAVVDLNGHTIYYIPMGVTTYVGSSFDPISSQNVYLGGSWFNGDVIAAGVPEPMTIAMLAMGALGLSGAAIRRLRRK
jgi:hypothetical protein